jgi:uncharacterized protein with HEPN domain
MNHPERLADYLKHISEAIDDATAFLVDCPSVDALAQDKRSQYAVIRALEILGEAATHMQSATPAFVAAHPGIPWHTMRGMRNTLMHAYADIDRQVVFDTVKDDLPPLKHQIAPLLAHLVQEEAQQRQEQGTRADRFLLTGGGHAMIYGYARVLTEDQNPAPQAESHR